MMRKTTYKLTIGEITRKKNQQLKIASIRRNQILYHNVINSMKVCIYINNTVLEFLTRYCQPKPY